MTGYIKYLYLNFACDSHSQYVSAILDGHITGDDADRGEKLYYKYKTSGRNQPYPYLKWRNG